MIIRFMNEFDLVIDLWIDLDLVQNLETKCVIFTDFLIPSMYF